MYWSELGSKSIKRAAMDGSSPSVFMEQVGRVHALSIDYEKRALYWAALDPPVIEYVYLNGTGRKVLLDGITMPYTLTIFNDSVFWGDWNTGKYYKSYLLSLMQPIIYIYLKVGKLTFSGYHLLYSEILNYPTNFFIISSFELSSLVKTVNICKKIRFFILTTKKYYLSMYDR